jgi:hypothetical protein
MNYLGAVTRIMRAETIIRGDTDAPTSFSDLQHGATIQLAQIAVQDELNELTSDNLLPYEKTNTGSITTAAGTRSYSLASDFVRFYGTPMLLTGTTQLFELRGGEDKAKLVYPGYKTDPGTPYWWYQDFTTTKKIAFYPVPTSAVTYTYDYERDVSLTSETDPLPFHNEQEAQAFCRLAARRFKFLYQEKDTANLMGDPEWQKARAALAAMIVGKAPPKSYAAVYR